MDIPGFADLQVNGYKDVDFSNPGLTEDRFIFACKELIKTGTVVFLPTIITSSAETFERNLTLMAEAIKHKDIREHVPGFHVEGPFISTEDGARGAHNREWVKKPDIAFLDRLFEWSGENIRLLTIAADVEGAGKLCRHAVELGITVSLGHQMAMEVDMQNLVRAGARSLTHLGNGLPKMLPRHENPLWAGMANDDLVGMIIPDGHHLPPSILKAIIRTKGVSNLIVVSDASPISGMPPGRYNTLGNNAVLEESGYLYNPDTGYLVGSSATMIECMKHLQSLDLLEIEDLITLGFHNPLKLIGMDPSEVQRNLQTSAAMDGIFSE